LNTPEKNKTMRFKILSITAIAMSLFTIYTTSIGVVSIHLQRTVHLTFAVILIILGTSHSKNKNFKSIIDLFLIGIVIICSIQLIITYPNLVAGGNITTIDITSGIIFIIILLEVARRTMGWTLPIIALIAISYSYFGSYFPQLFAHKGYSTERLIDYLFLTSDGIFGVALGTSATFIAALVLFAAFLEKSGAGKVFIDLALSLVGRTQSGPATVAIFSSSLMGSISGSAAANVMTTGVFTIPLMRRVGYRSHVAGAIESVASTGGQIIPPIMGAAAFVMAQYLGVPYAQIALAAIIPALLYYLGIFFSVNAQAGKQGLKRLEHSEIPKLLDVLRRGWITLVPLVILIFLLLVIQLSPILSAMYSIISILILYLLQNGLKATWELLVSSLEAGSKAVTTVAVACGIAGILVGVFMLTGLSYRLSEILIDLSNDNLFLLLVLMMVASMILGMGVPATPAYIIIAVLAIPSAIQLGVTPIAAHMFALYYAALANITPPIAIAAFAASSITEDHPMKTAFTAFKVAIVVYLIPFLFVYNPALLLKGTQIEIIYMTVLAFIVIFALSSSFAGWLGEKISLLIRGLLIAGSLMGVIGDNVTFKLLGISLIVIVSAYFYLWKKIAIKNA